MISAAAIEIRCDGRDRAQGDQCKSSQVLTLDLDELRYVPSAQAPSLRAAFFVMRLPGWGVGANGTVFCPNCKS